MFLSPQDLNCVIGEEDPANNCEQTTGRYGACYSPDTLDMCCNSCKTVDDFTLPGESRVADFCCQIPAAGLPLNFIINTCTEILLKLIILCRKTSC